MSVYYKDGAATDIAYGISGNVLSHAYDIEKNDLLSGLDDIVPGRLLVWHDEFDGSAVNGQKWNHLYGYYTSYRYYMYQNDLANNAFCQDGNLHYNNKKDSDMPLSDWTGAFIWTNNLFEFRYGLIEAKIKFPDNSSYHSTLWTMGAGYDRICYPDAIADSSKGLTWATCGELDIAEADNGVVTSTKIWEDSGGQTVYRGRTTLTGDGANWHIYGCEWTENYIKIYCDRVLKGTFEVSEANVGTFNAFRRPHFLILNQLPQSIGGGAQGQDYLETQVAWVRVYAPEGVSEVISDTALTLDSASLSMSVGGTHLLTGLFTPLNPTDMTITWTSSNPSVAMVYGGKVTALASGTATITATTKNGNTATCTVNVT